MAQFAEGYGADGLAGRTVLQVLPSLSEGGVERGTIEIVEALAAAGARPLVASAGGRLVPAVARAGGHHVTLPLMTKDPLDILLNARRLRRLIRAEAVDLVHARSRAPAWSALLAARRTGRPFVTTWHGVYRENLPGKRLYNSVMARGARVIAISDFVAARVARDYGVGPDRLRIIHRGADTRAFDPSRIGGERIDRLVRAWRLPDDAPVVLLAGRIVPWKGQRLAVEALARLADRRAVLVLVGSGKPREIAALCALAERLGVAERLRFAGHCADMPAAYAIATVVIAPSLAPEPFGRVVVEAQALGRLVVVSDHGGAAETVAHGVTGWRVPPGDAASLAAAVDAGLALPPEALALFGENARASVLERFSAARMGALTLAVYREVLGLAAPVPAPPVEETACASW